MPKLEVSAVAPLVTEHARIIGEGKRHHNYIAALDSTHVGTDRLNDADH